MPDLTSILVVEDDAKLRRVLGINLRAGRCDVIAAGTGREALATAAGHEPDAVVVQLRRKLEDEPTRPRYLVTEPGMGYRYQPRGVPAM